MRKHVLFGDSERKTMKVSVGEEREVYRAYPPMAEHYVSVGPFWIGIMTFLMLSLVGILLYIFGMSVCENGWTYAVNDIKDLLDECRWYHVVGIILFILFMGGLFFVPSFLTQYLQNTVTIFTDQRVYIKRYLRKDRVVTYEELAGSIIRRKISIKNGRYLIPCKGESISIPMIEGNYPGELFTLLEQKCRIRLPYADIRNRAQRSGAGWACGHLGGGMLMIFSLFITVFIFVGEGVFTWKRLLFDLYNPMTWFAVGLVGLGLLLNIFFWPSVWQAYSDYRKVIKVSVMPILTDYLILGIVIGGYLYCSHAGFLQAELIVEKSKDELWTESDGHFVRAFSRDVWGKEYKNVTEEELESIKYISIDFGGEGKTFARYSTKDYKDCADEQEFLESIQTWQCADEETVSSPADLSGFTGLTYLEIPEYEELSKYILPKDNQIRRIKMTETPKHLEEYVTPENVEVLQIEHYDAGNAFNFLSKYPNLRILEYTNSAYHGQVDLRKLSCLDSLERLYLACGDSYVHMEVLQGAESLRSIYIDKATLKQCIFVQDMQWLEELSVCRGEDGDLAMLAGLPKLKRLWLLDNVAIDASELESLKSVKELCVTIDSSKTLDAIKNSKEQFTVLKIRIEDWKTGIYDDDGSAYDFSGFQDMVKLEELSVVFEGFFVVIGAETLLEIPKLETLSLVRSSFGPQITMYIDKSRLQENTGVRTLVLGECCPMDFQNGEMLTDEFLSSFKGMESLSISGNRHGVTSFECLSKCEKLTSLYLSDVMLTEEQEQEIAELEKRIEVVRE